MCVRLNSEYIWKTNTSDNEDEDSMAFTLYKRYVFRPDLSNSLTGEEEVTTLHPGDIKSIALKYLRRLLNNYTILLTSTDLTCTVKKTN